MENWSKYNLFDLALEFREEDPYALAQRLPHALFVEWLVFFQVREEKRRLDAERNKE